MYVIILRIPFWENCDINRNKIEQPNQCGATLITSISFTSKLAFYIHNFAEEKISKKNK